MDFATLATERYSCRGYTDEPVSQEDIDTIIAAGLAAPTAVNKQPYRMWVLQSEAAIDALNQCTRFGWGAKTFIVVGALPDAAWTRKYDGYNFADIDASIVATHIMMQIHDLGLGSTWIGYFDAPKLAELIPELQGCNLIAIFPVGHIAPGEEGAPNPRHFDRCTAEEKVVYL